MSRQGACCQSTGLSGPAQISPSGVSLHQTFQSGSFSHALAMRMPVGIAAALRPYRRYRGDVNPGIAHEFSTAAYRFGHSMLSATLLRLAADGTEIAEGHIALQNPFFNPATIERVGIAPYLRGQATQVAQNIDSCVIDDDVRNLLFGPPGPGGFDLAALKIQRGRDPMGSRTTTPFVADWGHAARGRWSSSRGALALRLPAAGGLCFSPPRR